MKAFQLNYSEKLPCGADLEITPDEWYVYYDVPGIDKRYKRHTLRLYHKDLRPQAEALIRNLKRFQELLNQSDGQENVQLLERGMCASIGYSDFLDGVSMTGAVQDKVKDRQDLDLHIESWKYAVTRASHVQVVLKRCVKLLSLSSDVGEECD